METVEEQILRLEVEFIKNNLRSPNFLLLDLYSFIKLREELSGNHIEPFDFELHTYRGLEVAVFSDEVSPRIVLAS
jgi:hypothetical protein